MLNVGYRPGFFHNYYRNHIRYRHSTAGESSGGTTNASVFSYSFYTSRNLLALQNLFRVNLRRANSHDVLRKGVL